MLATSGCNVSPATATYWCQVEIQYYSHDSDFAENSHFVIMKAVHIHRLVADLHLNMLVITETWMQLDTPAAIQLDIAKLSSDPLFVRLISRQQQQQYCCALRLHPNAHFRTQYVC
jgi:hypothetical protein